MFINGVAWQFRGPITNSNNNVHVGPTGRRFFYYPGIYLRPTELCTGEVFGQGSGALKIVLVDISEYTVTCQSYKLAVLISGGELEWVKGEPGWDGIMRYGLFDACRISNPTNENDGSYTHLILNLDRPQDCGPGSQPTLTLTTLPQTPLDPRPAGTGGTSTLVLKAAVTENGSPKKDVVVTFKVEVKAGSGEHGVTGGAVHDHRGRAEKHSGTVTPISEKTNASGEVQIKFQAPILAGTHTITATCETCSNKTATKDVKVLVPDLVTLPADPRVPKNYILIGGDTPLGKNHPDNHYFTAAARKTLIDVTEKMFNWGWGVVGVNDGSLHDGGLFDIKGQWAPSHFEHRTGTEVDLSFINPKKVGGKAFEDVYEELCKKQNAAFDIQTLWHKADGIEQHFHMYLSGTGLRADALGRCCNQVFGPPIKDKKGNPILDKKGNPVLSKVCE